MQPPLFSREEIETEAARSEDGRTHAPSLPWEARRILAGLTFRVNGAQSSRVRSIGMLAGILPHPRTGVRRQTRFAVCDARSMSPARSASRTSSSLYASSKDRYGVQAPSASTSSTSTSSRGQACTQLSDQPVSPDPPGCPRPRGSADRLDLALEPARGLRPRQAPRSREVIHALHPVRPALAPVSGCCSRPFQPLPTALSRQLVFRPTSVTPHLCQPNKTEARIASRPFARSV